MAQVGGGRRNVSAIFCVQDSDAPADDVGDRIVGSCFPGDATLARVDAATGKYLGLVRMDEVAIGDAVQCLVPDGVREGDARDGAQAYLPGVCHVAYYLDAIKVTGASCGKGWRLQVKYILTVHVCVFCGCVRERGRGSRRGRDNAGQRSALVD